MSYKTSIRPSQLREDLLQCRQRLMLHQVCVLLKSTILGCYEPGFLSMTWFTTAYYDALCKAIIVAVVVIECILSKDTTVKPCSRCYVATERQPGLRLRNGARYNSTRIDVHGLLIVT